MADPALAPSLAPLYNTPSCEAPYAMRQLESYVSRINSKYGLHGKDRSCREPLFLFSRNGRLYMKAKTMVFPSVFIVAPDIRYATSRRLTESFSLPHELVEENRQRNQLSTRLEALLCEQP